jgi:hypothetical protein
MTLREFLYWNRLAQMECRKTPLHMAIYIFTNAPALDAPFHDPEN